MSEPKMLDCGHMSTPTEISAGYGIYNGRTYCADRNRERMIETGRATLYLTKREGKYTITNWPGSLSFPCGQVKKSWHNMAGTRYDTWFVGPDGYRWHAYNIGEFSEIAHGKRTKHKVK